MVERTVDPAGNRRSSLCGDSPAERWGKVFIYTSQGIMDNDLRALHAVIAVAKLVYDDPEVEESGRIVDRSVRRGVTDRQDSETLSMSGGSCIFSGLAALEHKRPRRAGAMQ